MVRATFSHQDYTSIASATVAPSHILILSKYRYHPSTPNPVRAKAKVIMSYKSWSASPSSPAALWFLAMTLALVHSAGAPLASWLCQACFHFCSHSFLCLKYHDSLPQCLQVFLSYHLVGNHPVFPIIIFHPLQNFVLPFPCFVTPLHSTTI